MTFHEPCLIAQCVSLHQRWDVGVWDLGLATSASDRAASNRLHPSIQLKDEWPTRISEVSGSFVHVSKMCMRGHFKNFSSSDSHP